MALDWLFVFLIFISNKVICVAFIHFFMLLVISA